MKTVTLIIGLVLFSTIGFSQEDSLKQKEPDTTKIRIGKSTVIIIGDDDSDVYYDFNSTDSTKAAKKKKNEDDDNTDLAIDFGMAGYLTPVGSTSLPANQSLMELNTARSNTIGLTIMFKEANLIKKRWYVRSGLGVNWTNYHFDNPVNISTGSDTTAFTLDTIRDFSKNKLRATYLQVPLLMGFRMGNLDNPFGVQFGVVGSYKIGSAVKQKYTVAGSKIKDKIRDDYNLNPFKLEAIARLSVDDFGFYAKYSFTELFEAGRAPELYPFSIGVTIGGF